MKKNILLFLFIFSFINTNAQYLLTNRLVFDFEVGDQFQYYHDDDDRNVYGQDFDHIIGKRYSTNADTVFYDIKNEYSEIENWQYGTRKQSISYYTDIMTNLDSNIFGYRDTFINDSNQYDRLTYAAEKNKFSNCDSIQINYLLHYGFEDNYYHSYGKGIGIVEWNSRSGSGNSANKSKKLIYYKKGGIECGTFNPNLFLGMEDHLQNHLKLELYQKDENLYVKTNIQSRVFQIKIFDIQGVLLYKDVFFNGIGEFNIQKLMKGIYIVQVETENFSEQRKWVKY